VAGVVVLDVHALARLGRDVEVGDVVLGCEVRRREIVIPLQHQHVEPGVVGHGHREVRNRVRQRDNPAALARSLVLPVHSMPKAETT